MHQLDNLQKGREKSAKHIRMETFVGFIFLLLIGNSGIQSGKVVNSCCFKIEYHNTYITIFHVTAVGDDSVARPAEGRPINHRDCYITAMSGRLLTNWTVFA